jgi:hypothetical protein
MENCKTTSVEQKDACTLGAVLLGVGENGDYTMRRMKRICSLLMLCLVCLPCVLAQQAQKNPADDTDNLVKQTQNPVASLISMPFQNNLNYPIAPFTRYQDVLNIQPVIPVGIGKWNLITRAILPVINRQDPLSKGGTRAGLGDLNITILYVAGESGKAHLGCRTCGFVSDGNGLCTGCT